ncbi:MAG: hypothetical protein L3J10_04080 [Sulfurimonas sp.]|nr:hypothetical protein [Sulfurimonas sp.]
MLYIIVALKSEAQAFVEKYKLTKSKYANFTIFFNKNIKIIISGIGIQNAKLTTLFIIRKFNPNKDDIFLNIGICGASKKYKIGDCIEISSILYNEEIFTLNTNTNNTIVCSNNEVSDNNYSIVDMESFGFYQACKNTKNCYMYKIVSDHFEPDSITKESTKKLIFNAIDKIIKRVKI